jgi:hypothetical protein
VAESLRILTKIAVHPLADKLSDMNHRFKLQLGRGTLGFLCIVAIVANGCGASVSADFANRLVGAGGELVVSEDVDLIVDDPNLSAEEKRTALRDLGIEDEELIDALLTL